MLLDVLNDITKVVHNQQFGRKIHIRDESTGSWSLNWDWEFECQHNHVIAERKELGTSSWDVPVCIDCDKEI